MLGSEEREWCLLPSEVASHSLRQKLWASLFRNWQER